MEFKVKLGVSARHLHVSQKDLEILFGEGAKLTHMKDLGQPGQFASNERVDLVGPKGTFAGIRILGPVRPITQVELSISEARKIGVVAPIRESGDIKGSGKATLVGPKGSIELEEGVIVAARHVHLTVETAEKYGIKDKDLLKIKLEGDRPTLFEGVIARVSPSFADEIHLDVDEGNASCAENDMMVSVILEDKK